MGLFVNDERHPDLFKNNEDLYEPNQTYYKVDPIEEMMKDQQLANETLQKSIRKLGLAYHQQQQIHMNRLKNLDEQLKGISRQNIEHKKHEYHVVGWLQKQDLKNKELTNQLTQQLELQEQVVEKLNNQEQKSEEIVGKLDNQELKSNEIVKRLEGQEVLMEKIVRQINYFRSILYERSHFLATKIESGYSNTTTYLTKLIARSNPKSSQAEKKEKSKEYS